MTTVSCDMYSRYGGSWFTLISPAVSHRLVCGPCSCASVVPTWAARVFPTWPTCGLPHASRGSVSLCLMWSRLPVGCPMPPMHTEPCVLTVQPRVHTAQPRVHTAQPRVHTAQPRVHTAQPRMLTMQLSGLHGGDGELVVFLQPGEELSVEGGGH